MHSSRSWNIESVFRLFSFLFHGDDKEGESKLSAKFECLSLEIDQLGTENCSVVALLSWWREHFFLRVFAYFPDHPILQVPCCLWFYHEGHVLRCTPHQNHASRPNTQTNKQTHATNSHYYAPLVCARFRVDSFHLEVLLSSVYYFEKKGRTVQEVYGLCG